METLCLNEDQAIAALRNFHWNNERLQEQWFNNETKVRTEIGIEFDQVKFKNQPKDKIAEMNASLKENHGGYCIVCYSSFSEGENDPSSKALALECGHEFCVGCWKENLKELVLNGAQKSLKAPCP